MTEEETSTSTSPTKGTAASELRPDTLALLEEVLPGASSAANTTTTVSVAEAFSLLCADSSSSSSEEEDAAEHSGSETGGSREAPGESVHVRYYKALFPERYGVQPVNCSSQSQPIVLVTMEDAYVSDLLAAAFEALHPPWKVHRVREKDTAYALHWGEYEDIDWFTVSETPAIVSCYYTRKGLIRKALLAQTMQKLSKKTQHKLQPMPQSYVLQLGPGTGCNSRKGGEDSAREEEVLERELVSIGVDVAAWQRGEQGRWILKPSMSNQGKGIRLLDSWKVLVAALNEADELERAGGLVLQKYVEPLLLSGRKFHLRVFVLVLGDCKVFVHRKFLSIVSLERYNAKDLTRTKAHLTNICHQDIQTEEDQEQCMRLFEEAAEELVRSGESRSIAEAKEKMAKVENDVLALTKQTMEAVTSELTFQARPNGFELFGFDFLVDEGWRVWLLEANAEPDLKMAGKRLQWVIDGMLREALHLVIAHHDHLKCHVEEVGEATAKDFVQVSMTGKPA